MPSSPRSRELALLACVLVVAVAGLVYELIAGTLSTYLLGNSVTVFSLVIGIVMTAGWGVAMAHKVGSNAVGASRWRGGTATLQ